MPDPSAARRRVGLLVNPTSGKGRGAAAGERARAQLVADGHAVVDLSGLDAEGARAHAAAALDAGTLDLLVVVGGDGLVHLGVNLVAGTGVPLGIVAAGTGNDNARELGLPVHAPEEAAALVARGRLRTIDAGRVVVGSPETGQVPRWFVGVLGGGFDSVVNERAHRMRWPSGPRRYDLAVLRELPVFRPIPYVVTVDDVRLETEAMLVAVGNGPAFGGGMRICPDASYDDGLFDVCVVHRLSVVKFLRVFPTVFRGTHLRYPEVQVLRGRHVRLEADGITSQADGERFEPLPLDVELVPGALEIVAPRT